MAFPDSRSIFLNVPFDSSYEPLFVTLVGTLVFLGLEPRCVLEVREKGDGRLVRIVELMRDCRMSIHDLSRTGGPARFNMPFELGLAFARKIEEPALYEILVMDRVPYRIDRTLSDYKGRDPLIHKGTCEGMLGCLLDTFESDVANVASEFRRATRFLRQAVQALKSELKAESLFRPAMFRRVVGVATEIAIERGFDSA